jgi:hypothetical protein
MEMVGKLRILLDMTDYKVTEIYFCYFSIVLLAIDI